MRIAVCTGIPGSDRIECLRQVQEYAKGKGKDLEIINMWDVFSQMSRTPPDEATILNVPDDRRMRLFEKAYVAVAEDLQRRYEKDTEKCAVVAAHALFHWRTTYLDAFPSYLLQSLGADVFVTIRHNIRNTKEKLDRNASHRWTDVNHSDILYWQDHESTKTRSWADWLQKPHFIVARNEPPETLYRILFEESTKKVYLSYPMSHVPLQEIEAARKLIAKLREIGYIVFDPGSIDDAKFADELLKNEPDNLLYKHLAIDASDHTVKLDYLLIEQSDLLIARYPMVKLPKSEGYTDSMYIPLSAGVICEMVTAFTQPRRVYGIWLPKTKPSPFFTYYCHERKCFSSEEELLAYLKEYDPPSRQNCQ